MFEICIGCIFVVVIYLFFDFGNWCGKFDIQEWVKNCVFFDVYEFGLIMKVFIIVVVFNDGIIIFDMVYEIFMSWYVGGCWGYIIGDVVDYFSSLIIQQVLCYLLNVGMSYIVEGFIYQKLCDYFVVYGFGQLVNLIGVVIVQGIFKFIDKWNDFERVINLFGQGVSGIIL